MTIKVDPVPYITEAVKDAAKRGTFSLVSPTWITDKDWVEANALIRKQGPLSDLDMMSFAQHHDRFASQHFMDLFFECERLYCIINWMNKKEP